MVVFLSFMLQDLFKNSGLTDKESFIVEVLGYFGFGLPTTCLVVAMSAIIKTKYIAL